MALSVVVPSLGREPRLEASLAALVAQGCKPIVVLQGGPADLAVAAAQQVVHFEQPIGFSAAVNAGLARVSSELVAVVNDDCVVDAGWADVLSGALERDPSLAAVQGTVRREDGRIDGAGIAWNRRWEAVQRGFGAELVEPSAATEVFGVSATAAIYRRSALENVGGRFDEVLGTWYEDVDIAGRLRAAGWRAALIPGAGAKHAGAATTAALGLAISRRVANRWLVLARLLGRELVLVAPRALVADLRQIRAGAGAQVVAGWARAVRVAPGFLHGGRPRLSRAELLRFGP